MQILGVCSTKGGAGKTTLATSLAVAACRDQRVALIDLDPQQTMAKWWEARGEPDNPQLIVWKTNLGVRYLSTAVGRLQEVGFDLVIVDTPPAILPIVETSIEASDFILIPTRASTADLDSIKVVTALAEKHGKDFAFVVNSAERRDSMTDDAIQYLKTQGKTITVAVGNRKAFRSAIAFGKSGSETDATAREEIDAVWTAVKKFMRASARKVA